MKFTVKQFQARTGLHSSHASIVLNFLARIGLATVAKEKVEGRVRVVYTLSDAVRIPETETAE